MYKIRYEGERNQSEENIKHAVQCDIIIKELKRLEIDFVFASKTHLIQMHVKNSVFYKFTGTFICEFC